MTEKELAEMLTGREVGEEVEWGEERDIKDAGLVAVYGYSDDNMEFRGAINYEAGSYDGGTVYLTKNGILEGPACSCAEDCECPYFTKEREKAKTIKAVWHDEGGPCWTFETDIPHETFAIMEDGEPWCIGIVFSMENLGGMKILSFGAGMQSTALALMACDNANMNKPVLHTAVPIYDAVIFCDLGLEPPWVMRQVDFTRRACEAVGIPFYILDTPLYQDFMQNFGERRTISIPWWTLKEDGHKSKMPRNCTIDYKIEAISKFVRWELLGYQKGQRLRPEDVKAHEMHMGFSAEEKQRCKESPNRLFVNRFPLVEMGLTRADNYKYILEEWGLDTKASACAFCPFHRNYFFQYIKEHEPKTYAAVIGVDNLLRDKNPKPPMDSDLFISRSRKRITDLTPEDCADAECFEYCGHQVWNGF